MDLFRFMSELASFVITSVADPGEGPGGPAPLIFRPKWGPMGGKKFFSRPAPRYLRVWMTGRPPPPSYLKVWIRHWTSLPADVLWGSFVTHSFLPYGPWGRNECVTNEPQRTSAGGYHWTFNEQILTAAKTLHCWQMLPLDLYTDVVFFFFWTIYEHARKKKKELALEVNKSPYERLTSAWR